MCVVVHGINAPLVARPMMLSMQDAVQVVQDRKSTRLNSNHLVISYAVFCLKKKNNETCDKDRGRTGVEAENSDIIDLEVILPASGADRSRSTPLRRALEELRRTTCVLGTP